MGNSYMQFSLPLVYFLSLPFLTHTQHSRALRRHLAMAPQRGHVTITVICNPNHSSTFICARRTTQSINQNSQVQKLLHLLWLLQLFPTGGFHSTLWVVRKGEWMTLWKVWRQEAEIESTKVKGKHSSSQWLIVRVGRQHLTVGARSLSPWWALSPGLGLLSGFSTQAQMQSHTQLTR